MDSKQMIVGNTTEEKVSRLFQKYRYWAHIMARTASGQPVDIVACKENKNWLVDAKHISSNKKHFTFTRVEANQMSSMEYAREFSGIKNLGFVFCVGDDYDKFLFLHYDKCKEMLKEGRKSVKISELIDFEEVIE